ncbi:MAG: 2-oxo acid dehydrogenase subunit E2 [Rhodocyclaceae bacterium]|nr:2-oxo acid dehydrogenase subunit E2 [Rhodocyclaceae bacterium]
MDDYRILPRNRFFEVVGGIMFENRGNDKVAMLSEIDMSEAIRLRESVAAETGEKPSYTAIVVFALARALREHDYANRTTIEWPFYRRIVQHNQVNVTVAVARDSPGLEQATYAGTIRDADTLSLVELNRQLRQLANAEGEHGERWELFHRIVTRLPPILARRILRIPYLWPNLWIQHRGGPAMVSSPAKYGVDMLVGNWPWPIGFSFGLVKERPIVINGEVCARPTMMLIMSFDRRLMAGAPAARFFNGVADMISQAEARIGPESHRSP